MSTSSQPTSQLANSHAALLRNEANLRGRLALIGVSDSQLLSALPDGGLAMSEHAGLCVTMNSQQTWKVAFGYDDLALSAASADTVVLFVPKSRAEMNLRLALGLWLVSSGGRVLLVGEKKEGVAGAVKQLKAVLPQAEKIDSAKHCQVWLAEGVQPEPAFRLADWLQWHSVERAGSAVSVAGLPGIFSDGELDAGTAMLLDTLAESPLKNGATLDFACGAGVIGAWLQQYLADQGQPGMPVDGVDVQAQAVFCARATYDRARANGVITASDGLAQVQGRYRNLLTNPPFHTGVRTDTSMTEAFLAGAAKHLVSGGELRLVANRFLPYEGLIRQHVGSPRVLAENKRFIVWSATRR